MQSATVRRLTALFALCVPLAQLATAQNVTAQVVAQVAPAQAAEDANMKSAKRRVPEPPPVVQNGVRYQVEFGGKSHGFPQIGGVIAAVDDATERVLWTVVVYRVTFNPNKEEDTQEVFITDLALNGDGTRLIVTNEEGNRLPSTPPPARSRRCHNRGCRYPSPRNVMTGRHDGCGGVQTCDQDTN
jgi:hypothetical protein